MFKDSVDEKIQIDDLIAVVPRKGSPRIVKIVGFTKRGTPKIKSLTGDNDKIYHGQPYIKSYKQNDK